MRLKDITIFSPQYVGDNIDGDVSFVPMESLRNGTIDYKTIRTVKSTPRLLTDEAARTIKFA